MKVGDVVTMRTVRDRSETVDGKLRSEVIYKAPKGELFAFVLLGTTLSGGEFDADAAMESLGWHHPSTELTVTVLQNEITRRDARIEQLERKYAEACALRVSETKDAERYRALRKWHDAPNIPEFNLDEGADALIEAGSGAEASG